MITFNIYKEALNNKGKNLSEIRKKDSARVVNSTFFGDVGYKKAYILNPNKGWEYVDVKYSRHSKQSISSDAVDYYLQFRPYINYPIGTYVFIPNDESDEIGFSEEAPVDPFVDENFQSIFDSGKLWMIVDRDNANEFVRYMILQCDYNVKWIEKYNGIKKILHCYGITRTQNSYTSGVYTDHISTSFDEVTSLWLPDTYYVFKENMSKYNLDDTRYFRHELRLMLTTNVIHPKCYKVTKIEELATKGILKCTLKQDEFDERKDYVDLLLCNYYDDDGDLIIDPINAEEPIEENTSTIYSASLVNEELIKDETFVGDMKIGINSYFIAEFSNLKVTNPEWRISYANNSEADETLSEDRKQYYCNLMNINNFGKNKLGEISISSISIKPNKVKSLIGKKFLLSVQDYDGQYKSSVELEVTG